MCENVMESFCEKCLRNLVKEHAFLKNSNKRSCTHITLKS